MIRLTLKYILNKNKDILVFKDYNKFTDDLFLFKILFNTNNFILHNC